MFSAIDQDTCICIPLSRECRGVSREGLEHPPSLPDFTEILPICLQLLFLTFTFVLMTQYTVNPEIFVVEIFS